jgi:hypothetical protein
LSILLEEIMNRTLSSSLPETVEGIIKATFPKAPDPALIKVVGPDSLSREMRIDSSLTNANGELVSLKLGARVEVIVEAQSVDKEVEK